MHLDNQPFLKEYGIVCVECAPKLKNGSKSFLCFFIIFWILIALVIALKFILGIN
jgi:hypothetical protein